MKVALVLTIKNEARLLKSNLLYHLSIGVEKAYIYLDGTTDDSANTVKDLNNVEVCDSVSSEKYSHKKYLEKFWSQAEQHHTARQCLNTYDALQKCKAQDIDWLISLDADELFVPDSTGKVSLASFFKDTETKNVELVYFKTLEVISRQLHYDKVMYQETQFKTKKNFKSKFDQIYFKIGNPYSNKASSQSYWLGHTMGKAAIKVASEIIPKNVHRYQTISGGAANSIQAGLLLHYHLYDFENFIKKYQNFKQHPEVYLSGNKINGLKRLWITMVNDPNMSDAYLMAYYKTYLLFTDKKMKRLGKTRFGNVFKRKEPASVTIDYPQNVLETLRH